MPAIKLPYAKKAAATLLLANALLIPFWEQVFLPLLLLYSLLAIGYLLSVKQHQSLAVPTAGLLVVGMAFSARNRIPFELPPAIFVFFVALGWAALFTVLILLILPEKE